MPKTSRDIRDALRDAETISGNVVRELQKIVDLQARHLNVANKLNLGASILHALKEKQHSTDRLLEATQESIFKKTQKLLDLERKGAALTSSERSTRTRLINQLKAAKTLHGELLVQSTVFKNAVEGLVGQAGFGGMVSLTKTLGALWKIHPMLAATSLLLSTVKVIVGVFNKLDEEAWKFRETMGVTRTVTKDIDNFIRATAINLAHLGVTANQLYNSFVEIGRVIGTTQATTKGMATDMAILRAQVGVAESTSANFLKTMAMMGGTTMDAQRNMLFFAQHMSEAAGTNLNEVMNDVASASKTGYRFLSRNPIELVKATIEAKKLGTSLKDLTSSAATLIDFSKSVTAEMEASVLLGESINLQRARELAYRKDLRGLNEEILRIAQQTNFENLDPLQQQAVATALGKSADELGTMVQAAREQREIDRAINADPKLRERRKLLNEMEKATASQAKNYAEIARTQLTTQQNQSRITSISNSWNKIVMKLAAVFLPAVDAILGFVANHLGKILLVAAPIGIAFMKWSGAFKFLMTVLRPVWSLITNIFGRLSGAFRVVGGGAAMFGKWIPVIGWIITGVLFVINLFKRLGDVIKVFREEGFWKGMVAAIGAVWGAVYDTLIQPFVSVWNWLKTTFMGSSPSKLGLLIVEGIRAVKSMLIGVLVSPFQMAWGLIKKIPFVGSLFKNIGTSVADVVAPVVTIDRTATNPPDASIRTDRIPPNIIPSNDEVLKKLSEIVISVDKLTAGFANGSLKATVNIDAQKVDAAMGRSKEFKGELVS